MQLCAVFTEKALDFVPLDVSLYVLGILIGSEVVFSVMMLVEVCSLVSMPCHNYVMSGSATARTVLFLFLFLNWGEFGVRYSGVHLLAYDRDSTSTGTNPFCADSCVVQRSIGIE